MKNLFAILVILLVVSCAAPKAEFREIQMPFTVTEIQGDSAKLESRSFRVPYYVESEGLIVGETRFFFLNVFPPEEIPREFRATIYKSFPITQVEEIRRALKVERYLKF